ncbi:sorbosone dehydrogenase family protein [Cellulosimicrobium sp. CUA-896]|uniref:PQQ-dependent sugar dehydrogenase n=1 Tax=Cellulosimicrobium sp. CUA-896 TaxID=1517881 RepID=UPI002100FC13|nr:PQQ-dependent sugar dehydrogenase [Cellulosimicrobium sp. CUA-896]
MTGLTNPWSLVFLEGTPIVSERNSGRVLELLDDGTAREVGAVAGLDPGVAEGGLLGLALDGQGRLYAFSTGQDGNRIQRFTLRGRPGSLALGAPETVLDAIPAGRRHNGGRIAFGPDGMLYAGVGDNGTPDVAQDTASLAGKILRMTPDGDVPADNPFPDSYVYSYGHRNVQGLAWSADGTMFASEFGQDTWDELNIITPGGNYGWPVAEGTSDGEFVDPVQQWEPAEASPSGIAVVGDTIFVANLRGEVLRSVPVPDPSRSEEHYAGAVGRLRAVAEGPDGRLWLVTGNTGSFYGTPRAGDDRVVTVGLAPR